MSLASIIQLLLGQKSKARTVLKRWDHVDFDLMLVFQFGEDLTLWCNDVYLTMNQNKNWISTCKSWKRLYNHNVCTSVCSSALFFIHPSLFFIHPSLFFIHPSSSLSTFETFCLVSGTHEVMIWPSPDSI